MPVQFAYDGDSLFNIVWGEGHEILSITPNYAESEQVLNDTFPKDKIIFLMCGGGGYASLTRSMLINLGWDENMIYNTGGNWYYEGNMSLDMTVSGIDNETINEINENNIATWRVNYAHIDFSRLTAIDSSTGHLPVIPPPTPDGGPFGVYVNINVNTVDGFLHRPDAVYLDMRLKNDPADFQALGGTSYITHVLPGFRNIPFPYVASLSPMPVNNAYSGDSLFNVVWNEWQRIVEISPNYEEAEYIINRVFPKDKKIFLLCGGGGYSALTKRVLVALGWDEDMIYNVGGFWYYNGDMAICLEAPENELAVSIWNWEYSSLQFSFEGLNIIE
jgi:rhodanese-related sulfurtransferase